MTAAAQRRFAYPVAGDGAFSTWSGATFAGRGALWLATADLAEIRDIPHGDRLPQGSVVHFCRSVTLDGDSARFLGVMRIAPDSKNRRGVHGYGVLIEGRDAGRLGEAFDLLDGWGHLDESTLAHLSSPRAFADPEGPPAHRSDVALFSAGHARSFALPPDADRYAILKTLWSLSYTMPGIRDLFAARALADLGVEPLPPCPAVPAQDAPAPAPEMPYGSPQTTYAQPDAAHSAHAASRRSDAVSEHDDPFAEIAQPIPIDDPEALRRRVDVLSETILVLTELLEQQGNRIDALAARSRTADGKVASKAQSHGLPGERGSGMLGLEDTGRRIPWPEIAIGGLAAVMIVVAAYFTYTMIF